MEGRKALLFEPDEEALKNGEETVSGKWDS